VLRSPYLTLIFTLDDPLQVIEHPDPAQPPERYRTLVGGLHTRPALITHDGAQSGVQLSLDPLGLGPWWGCRRASWRHRTCTATRCSAGSRIWSRTSCSRGLISFLERAFGFAATVVIANDDEQGTVAHAELAPPHDTDYGSREFAVRDLEGNLWSLGTYRGQPRR